MAFRVTPNPKKRKNVINLQKKIRNCAKMANEDDTQKERGKRLRDPPHRVRHTHRQNRVNNGFSKVTLKPHIGKEIQVS